MRNLQKGVSLIALIITIAVLIIIATAVLQNGMQRTDDAKLAKHNTNISQTQEEVENYYYYKGAALPVVNQTPYDITSKPTLLAEITKNNEQNDTFYILDLSKLGKTSGKDGTGTDDDIYIVSSTRHNVYYVRGIIIKGITYHGLITKNDIKLAQITGGATPTNSPTPTPGSSAYNNPKIPNGFSYVSGTWDEGYTIRDSNLNEFVWVPVGSFTVNSTPINNPFQRTAFSGETFNASNYYETDDIVNITNSVNTYGGFYIAKYEISSANGQDGASGDKAESKANRPPWTGINWTDARAEAEAMDAGWDTSVESVLCYGAHWDTALQWLMVDTGSGNHKTLAQIKDDSTTWGNYWNATFTYGSGSTNKAANTNVKINTGVSTTPANRHMAKGIYDLAGNVWEWTMENNTSSYRVYRGGLYYYNGNDGPAAYRNYFVPTYSITFLGFRVALYLK